MSEITKAQNLFIVLRNLNITHSNFNRKSVYIGLQRSKCYEGNNRKSFYNWRDTCLEPQEDDLSLSTKLKSGYTSPWFNLVRKPMFPIGDYPEYCNDQQFWFTDDPILGPYDDFYYGANYLGAIVGAYCRKGKIRMVATINTKTQLNCELPSSSGTY